MFFPPENVHVIVYAKSLDLLITARMIWLWQCVTWHSVAVDMVWTPPPLSLSSQHHIKYQHLLKKKYVCPHPSCGRLFRLQKQLLRHAKHHTGTVYVWIIHWSYRAWRREGNSPDTPWRALFSEKKGTAVRISCAQLCELTAGADIDRRNKGSVGNPL